MEKKKKQKSFWPECQARELSKYCPRSVFWGRFSDTLKPPFLQSGGIYVMDLRRETVGLTGDRLQEHLTLGRATLAVPR